MSFTKTPMTAEERKANRRVASLQYYYDNRNEVRVRQNAQKQADPIKTAAQRRAYRAADPEKYRAYGRKEQAIRREKYPWLAAFHSRRKHAEKKGLMFTLTTEWAKAVYTGYCTLTGIPFDVRSCDQVGNPGPRPHSISIDKIDATKGYTPANCRFVLNAVNTMRGSGSDTEMLHITRALLARADAETPR